MPSNLGEIEILLNKHALHKARLEKLLEESGLGFTHSPDNDELERTQVEELRNQNAELQGLGYKPKDNVAELKRKAMSSDERLRRQLLGKNAKSDLPHNRKKTRPSVQSSGKPSNDQGADSAQSDDEGGRAAAVALKARSRHVQRLVDAPNVAGTKRASSAGSEGHGHDAQEDEATVISADSSKRLKKGKVPLTYLDEILEKKAKRRKKKKKKEGKNGQETGAQEPVSCAREEAVDSL